MKINKEELEQFITQFDNFTAWNGSKQTDYFAYYLTEAGDIVFTSKDIDECFALLSLKKYSRLAAYLSENVSSKKGKYLKGKVGYSLERGEYSSIKKIIQNEPVHVEVSKQLLNLSLSIKDSQETAFLNEALNCYRVESYRAAIILIWILAIDHLQKYIFGLKLNDFNLALSKNPDKKIKQIINYDDFSELSEIKFIELMRSANIVSNDVRKILDEKLGIRNSAAHPSGVIFSGHKTTEFALDLINNILLKY